MPQFIQCPLHCGVAQEGSWAEQHHLVPHWAPLSFLEQATSLFPGLINHWHILRLADWLYRCICSSDFFLSLFVFPTAKQSTACAARPQTPEIHSHPFTFQTPTKYHTSSLHQRTGHQTVNVPQWWEEITKTGNLFLSWEWNKKSRHYLLIFSVCT